jgi:hypothetical protein
MAEFTKRGHKLMVDGMLLTCMCRTAVVRNDGEGEKAKATRERSDAWRLADLLIYAPCPQGRIVSIVRAWLAAFDDEELLAQVEDAVAEALAKMPEAEGKLAPPPTSPPPPPSKLTN